MSEQEKSGPEWHRQLMAAAPDARACQYQFCDAEQNPLHRPISLIDSAKMPPVPSGSYYIQWLDNEGVAVAATVHSWQTPELPQTKPVPTTPEGVVTAAVDAVASIEVDGVIRDELTNRKRGEHQRLTLEYYNKLVSSVGARGVQEVNDKITQSTQLLDFTNKMIEQYVDLLERSTERLRQYSAPPAPPEPVAWDRIVAAVVPTAGNVFTDLIRTVKGVPPTLGTGLMGLQSGESNAFELLDKVGSVDKFSTLLGDREALTDWLASVQQILKGRESKPAAERSEAATRKA